ncbi:hypothetical protein CJ030_MR7G011447 [Morella rubra]|uniref:Uncharacterized protein n=1 Tax=Morella rubra TaxID=262757 RepID=A0A6A1V4I2_9ROSI|nr:hypothetical protein CJ030_MR7G011447 [Morella rubra]
MGSGESTLNNNDSTRPEDNASRSRVASAVAAASVLAATCGAIALMSGSETTTNKKTMKAPGGNGAIMNRDDFEKDPKGYFSANRDRNKK